MANGLWENPVPTLFVTLSDQQTPSPKKRRKLDLVGIPPATLTASIPTSKEDETVEDNTAYPSLKLEQITREADVRFFTGLRSTIIFKFLFDRPLSKAENMQYWRGARGKTSSEFEAERHGAKVLVPFILGRFKFDYEYRYHYRNLNFG